MLMDQTYEFEELCINVAVGDNGSDVRTYWVDGSCEYTVKPGWHGSEDEPASNDYIEDINNIVIDKIYDVSPEVELCFAFEEDGTCNWFLNRVIKEVDNYLRNDSRTIEKMLSEFEKVKEELALDFALSSIKDF